MKRKNILKVAPVQPNKRNKKKYSATAQIVVISNVKHLIVDVFNQELEHVYHVYRMAITNTDFENYIYKTQRWTKRNIYNEDLDDKCWDWDNNISVDKKYAEVVSSFTKKNTVNRSIFEAVNDCAWDINRALEQKSYEKKIKQKEIDMSNINDLPNDFNAWVDKKTEVLANLYYKRFGKKKVTIRCSKCGEEYTTFISDGSYEDDLLLLQKAPEKGEYGTCSCCGAQGIYQQGGKCAKSCNNENFYLVQRTKDNNLVIRYFAFWRDREKNTKDKESLQETIRIFLEFGKVRKYYRMFDYFKNKLYWSTANNKGFNSIQLERGYLYEGYQDEIKNSNFKYCDIDKLYQFNLADKVINKRGSNIKECLVTFAKFQGIEMLLKSGLTELVRREIIWEGDMPGIHKKATSFESLLQIDKRKIKLLVNNAGERRTLEMLQLEKKRNELWSNQQERWVLENTYFSLENITYLLKFMSIQKLINYIEKQKKTYKNANVSGLLNEYKDYLEIMIELNYSLENSVYLFPKNLFAKHLQRITERNNSRDERYASKMEKKYKKIMQVFSKLDSKYHFENQRFEIRPAHSAKEIIQEGRILHHCVGGDGYLRSHNNEESTILLLREKSCLQVPFVTVEIKDGSIKQWYGIKDSNPRKKVVERVLKEFLEQLNQRSRKDKQYEPSCKRSINQG